MRLDDVLAEMASNPPESFIPAEEVQKLLARLDESDPCAVVDWLVAHRAPIITEYLGALFRSARTHARRHDETRAALDLMERGATESVFRVITFEVDGEHTRMRVGAMRREHWLYVATSYEASAKEDLLQAAFARAVAKRIGRQTTEEALSEEQYQVLYQSIHTT